MEFRGKGPIVGLFLENKKEEKRGEKTKEVDKNVRTKGLLRIIEGIMALVMNL